MPDPIAAYIQCFAQPPTDQIQAFIAAGRPRTLLRKATFVEAGRSCEEVAFIHRGVMRYRVIDPSTGDDHTKDFSFPNSFTTAYTSVVTRSPSQLYISAVNDVLLTV